MGEKGRTKKERKKQQKELVTRCRAAPLSPTRSKALLIPMSRSSSSPADLEQPLEQRVQLDKWRRRIKICVMSHEYLATTYNKFSRWMICLSVTLSAIVTSTIFASDDCDASHTLHWVGGILAALTTIVQALSAKLGHAELAERHQAAVRQHLRLRTRLNEMDRVCQLPVTKKDGEMQKRWQEWINDFVQATDDAPVIKKSVYDYFKHTVKKEVPESCCLGTTSDCCLNLIFCLGMTCCITKWSMTEREREIKNKEDEAAAAEAIAIAEAKKFQAEAKLAEAKRKIHRALKAEDASEEDTQTELAAKS